MRKLSKKEIENTLSFLHLSKYNCLPKEIGESVLNIHKKRLRTQLEKVEIYPHLLPELKKQIEQQYIDSLVTPGDMVGIATAQCIGEMQTQTNLNVFHKAGSVDNDYGFGAKFSDLLNATKNPKHQSNFIYFTSGNKTIQELRETVGSKIVEIRFQKLIQNYEVFLIKEDEPWYASFEILYNNRFRDFQTCISFKINMDIVFQYKIPLSKITNMITSMYNDVTCVFSPDVQGQIDVFVDLSIIDDETEKLQENKKINLTVDEKKEIYIVDVVIEKLKDILICGISGIKEMFFNNRDNEWYIETEGSNYINMFSLPNVDKTKVLSSNAWDIYRVLGLEATRKFLINQFSSILPSINKAHIELLVDRMLHREYTSITRYTMRSSKTGLLSKMTFEEPIKNLIEASFFGTVDDTSNVSAKLLLGKRMHAGTDFSQIKFSFKMLEKGKETEKKSKEKPDILTKFEYTKILGVRATQIANGAHAFVEYTNPYDMAKEELASQTMPLLIERVLPNNKKIIINPNKCIIPK